MVYRPARAAPAYQWMTVYFVKTKPRLDETHVGKCFRGGSVPDALERKVGHVLLSGTVMAVVSIEVLSWRKSHATCTRTPPTNRILFGFGSELGVKWDSF